MVKAVIVEDDAKAIEILSCFLKRFSEENQEVFSVSQFTNGRDFLDSYKGNVDIVFMDIQLPLLNGMEVAKRLRQHDPDVCIVFITNMAQYAIKGYEVAARDFILKPLQYVDFSYRMKKVISYCKSMDQKEIILKDKTGFRRIKLRDIYYVEIMSHTVTYHTANGDFSYRGSMKKTMEQLGGSKMFACCSQSYLVNLRHIDGLRNNTVYIHGCELRISRSKRESFMAQLMDYIKEV